MPDHALLYHRSLGHPGMVQQLLREFVQDPWVADLDFDRMERSNARYHADDDQWHEADVVWRIPLRSGGDLRDVAPAPHRINRHDRPVDRQLVEKLGDRYDLIGLFGHHDLSTRTSRRPAAKAETMRIAALPFRF